MFRNQERTFIGTRASETDEKSLDFEICGEMKQEKNLKFPANTGEKNNHKRNIFICEKIWASTNVTTRRSQSE